MASTHGAPAWSIPSTLRRAEPHIQPPSLRDLHRLVFELRNLLENSSDLKCALDVVDDIENALKLSPAIPIPKADSEEAPSKLELGPLVDETLSALSPLLKRSGVTVLRRIAAEKIVFAQRNAVSRLLEDVFKTAIVACGRSSGLHVLRIRTRNGRHGLCELAIEHSGPRCDEPAPIHSVAQHVQFTQNTHECTFKLTFLRRT